MRYSYTATLAILNAYFCLVASQPTNTCLRARTKCTKQIGCSMALNNINIACSSVRRGTVKGCPPGCMRAIASLVTVENNLGIDYLTCDCQGNADCEDYKTKISSCSSGVLSALETLDNEQVISCNLARMLCEAETSCYTSLANYEQDCWQLWSGSTTDYSCDGRCKTSVEFLHLERRSKKLINCQCDNSDPLISQEMCMKMRNNTDIYCLKKLPQTYQSLDNVETIQITDGKKTDNLITAASLSVTENNAASSVTSLLYVTVSGILVCLFAGQS